MPERVRFPAHTLVTGHTLGFVERGGMARYAGASHRVGVDSPVLLAISTAVILAGFSVIGMALSSLPTQDVPALIFIASASGLASFAVPMRLGYRTGTLHFPFAFLGLICFGLPGIAVSLVAATGFACVAGRHSSFRALYFAAFNMAALALGAVAAVALFRAAGASTPPEDLQATLAPAFFAVSAYYVVKTSAHQFIRKAMPGRQVSALQLRETFTGFANHLWLALFTLMAALNLPGHSGAKFLLLGAALASPWAISRIATVMANQQEQRKRHLEHLATLQRVGQAANATQDLDGLADTIFRGAREMAGVSGVRLFVDSARDGALEPFDQAAAGKSAAPDDDLELWPGDIARIRAGAVVEKTKKAHGSERVLRSKVFYPLMSGGRCIGIIGFRFDGRPDPKSESAHLLRTLVGYTSAALERLDYHNNLRGSYRRLFTSQESVRNQISSTLHGSVQTKILLMWHRLGELVEHDESDSKGVAEIRKDLQGLLDEVRTLSRDLYPAIVKIGLRPALRSLESRLSGLAKLDTAVAIDVDKLEAEGAISDDLRTVLYRIAEEAVNNAVKHGKASGVTIELAAPDRNLILTIRDNGAGFVPEKAARGLGLQMMHDYANAVGGWLKVDAQPGRGTVVSAVVPVPAKPLPPGGGHPGRARA